MTSRYGTLIASATTTAAAPATDRTRVLRETQAEARALRGPKRSVPSKRSLRRQGLIVNNQQRTRERSTGVGISSLSNITCQNRDNILLKILWSVPRSLALRSHLLSKTEGELGGCTVRDSPPPFSLSSPLLRSLDAFGPRQSLAEEGSEAPRLSTPPLSLESCVSRAAPEDPTPSASSVGLLGRDGAERGVASHNIDLSPARWPHLPPVVGHDGDVEGEVFSVCLSHNTVGCSQLVQEIAC
ncbi:hypothetical protein O3P69_008838 [Scylla paramamosain]|uniref:Uncharacterized protein n=1 Tax=Scylla paramamosain TaxID=85552 RepID=A0AAW0TNS7_SCYPA